MPSLEEHPLVQPLAARPGIDVGSVRLAFHEVGTRCVVRACK